MRKREKKIPWRGILRIVGGVLLIGIGAVCFAAPAVGWVAGGIAITVGAYVIGGVTVIGGAALIGDGAADVRNNDTQSNNDLEPDNDERLQNLAASTSEVQNYLKEISEKDKRIIVLEKNKKELEDQVETLLDEGPKPY